MYEITKKVNVGKDVNVEKYFSMYTYPCDFHSKYIPADVYKSVINV